MKSSASTSESSVLTITAVVPLMISRACAPKAAAEAPAIVPTLPAFVAIAVRTESGKRASSGECCGSWSVVWACVTRCGYSACSPVAWSATAGESQISAPSTRPPSTT